MSDKNVVVINGRVKRLYTDAVGNTLNADLLWCDTHAEPVWVYHDGSYGCPYDCVVEARSDDHRITTAPWEG